MLETIREYALEKLEERGETAPCAIGTRRHSSRSRRRPASARLDPTAAAAAQARQLDRFEDEHDNLRTALEYLIAAGDTERASALVFALWRFWHMRGHIDRGARPRRPRARDAAMDRRADADARLARARGRRRAGVLGRRPGRRRAATTGSRRRGPRAWATTARSPTPLYNLFFARRPASDPAEWIDAHARGRHRRCWTRRWRSGRGSATKWAWARPCGASASGTRYRGDFARRRGCGDAGDRDLRADRRSVLGQLVEVHACVRAGHGAATCRAPRATSGPRCASSGRAATFPGLALVLSAVIEPAPARRPSRRRLRDGRRRAPPGRRDGPAPRDPLAERPTSRSSTPTPRIPTLQAAIARGRAWTREEAVERTLASPRPSPRRPSDAS